MKTNRVEPSMFPYREGLLLEDGRKVIPLTEGEYFRIQEAYTQSQAVIAQLLHALKKALPWIDPRALPEIGEAKQVIESVESLMAAQDVESKIKDEIEKEKQKC